MKTLSRGAWIALAAVLAVPATIAIAKNYERGGWNRMSPETRERLQDGKMAMAKAALKLTPDQEKLFTPVEEQVRAQFKDRAEKRAEKDKKREERRAAREARKAEGGDGNRGEGRESRKRADLAERFETMSADLSKKAERMKSFSGAFKPFYASLTDEQKDVLRPLMRDLAPGFGGRGGRGHGKRWAHGGGWGGHGKGDRDWRGKRGDRDTPVIEDKAEAGSDGADAPEAPEKAD